MSESIAIVTSVSNGYGRWLHEWADSIIRQTVAPEEIRIFVHGSCALDHIMARRAAYMFQQQGWSGRVSIRSTMKTRGVGWGRNEAVAMTSTDWVLHLDADDCLMPHALEDFHSLTAGADIVGFGYKRSGKLQEGPRNRTRTYRDLPSGQDILRSSAPCSGVSPFRRRFWEQAPYLEDMSGGWDTALWLGFAHLGARLRATKRPVFWYRQHGDSVFNTRRTKYAGVASPVGQRLQSIRRKPGTIIFPWKAGDPYRELSREFVQRWYTTHFPGWRQIVSEGDPTSLEWRKGDAINRGLLEADGEVVIIADADCVPDLAALKDVIAKVRSQTHLWGQPHTRVRRLDEKSTQRIYDGEPFSKSMTLHRSEYNATRAGGIVVARRTQLISIYGAPEGFKGWGCEDEAWSLQLTTLLGKPYLKRKVLWHLYHPPGLRTKDPNHAWNHTLLEAFQRASGDPEKMLELIRPTGGTAMEQVKMIALMSFSGLDRMYTRGETFYCTEEEARFYENPKRKRPFAARVTPEGYQTKLGFERGPDALPRRIELRRKDSDPEFSWDDVLKETHDKSVEEASQWANEQENIDLLVAAFEGEMYHPKWQGGRAGVFRVIKDRVLELGGPELAVPQIATSDE